MKVRYDLDNMIELNSRIPIAFTQNWRDKLDVIKNAITDFIMCLPMEGEGADNIKAYFEEVHYGIIALLNQYFDEINTRYSAFLATALQLDPIPWAILDTDTLHKFANDFVLIKDLVNNNIASVNAVIEEADHLAGVKATYSGLGAPDMASDMSVTMAQMVPGADLLEQELFRVDGLIAGEVADGLGAFSSALVNLILNIKNREGISMSTYTAGDLANMESYDKAVQQADNSKLYVDEIKDDVDAVIDEAIQKATDAKKEQFIGGLLDIKDGIDNIKTGITIFNLTTVAATTASSVGTPVAGIAVAIPGYKLALDHVLIGSAQTFEGVTQIGGIATGDLGSDGFNFIRDTDIFGYKYEEDEYEKMQGVVTDIGSYVTASEDGIKGVVKEAVTSNVGDVTESGYELIFEEANGDEDLNTLEKLAISETTSYAVEQSYDKVSGVVVDKVVDKIIH